MKYAILFQVVFTCTRINKYIHHNIPMPAPSPPPPEKEEEQQQQTKTATTHIDKGIYSVSSLWLRKTTRSRGFVVWETTMYNLTFIRNTRVVSRQSYWREAIPSNNIDHNAFHFQCKIVTHLLFGTLAAIVTLPFLRKSQLLEENWHGDQHWWCNSWSVDLKML